MKQHPADVLCSLCYYKILSSDVTQCEIYFLSHVSCWCFCPCLAFSIAMCLVWCLLISKPAITVCFFLSFLEDMFLIAEALVISWMRLWCILQSSKLSLIALIVTWFQRTSQKKRNNNLVTASEGIYNHDLVSSGIPCISKQTSWDVNICWYC